MLLAPEDIYEKLEFDKLLEILSGHCLGEPAVEKALKLPVHHQKMIIDQLLVEVTEFKTAFEQKHRFPLSNYVDLQEEFRFLEIEGFVLAIEQLHNITRLLHNMKGIYQFFKDDKIEAYPNLYSIIREVSFQDDLLRDLDKVIDEKGNMRSDASPELMRIRRLQISKRKELERTFRGIINTYKSKGWLADTVESFRNGRRVLTVPAEYKRQIRGIIHDESATGKTTYLEPEGVIQINNDIFDLENDEKREIHNILKGLSEQLRPYLSFLQAYHGIVIRYDLIRAKASLALQMNAFQPKVQEHPFVGIINGFHPLLYLKNQHEGKNTVPFTLTFKNKNRILILSGPNAGGKSICLKSLGLLQLMMQAGILVPCDPASEMGIFEQIFIDMGDQQSLEDELSTYSSRLKNAKYFLDHANDKTLLLIDEFGSGTDPKIGGAIAESILVSLNKRNVFGLITTHYSNLKVFAYKTRGIINGCMTFDKDNLSPTYELTVGRPGSSYAFEIAQKSGLAQDVIKYAKHKTGKNEKAIDQLLVDLQSEKQELVEKVTSLEQKQKDLDRLIRSYDQMNRELDVKRKRLRLDIKQHELQQTAKTNKELERVVKQLREEKNLEKAQALLKRTKEEKQEISVKVQELDEAIYQNDVKKHSKNGPIEVGDFVRLRTGGEASKVESIRKKQATIILNNLRMTVKLRDLVHADTPITAPVKGKIMTDTLSKTANFSPKIDLRGMRREEALKMLEVFVDEALIANSNSLRIIHGKGDGILRKAVKHKLREYKAVTEVRHEEQKAGGDGVTIVELG